MLQIFKYFIYSAERYFYVKDLIIIFRTDQELSIGNNVQRLLAELGIDIIWSAINVKEQNGAIEYSGSLLIVKAYCI